MTGRFLLALAAALGLAALSAPHTHAAKPGGGGDSTLAGVVYFQTYDPTTGIVRMNRMNPDGTGKTILPDGTLGAPTHDLHGGHRWFVSSQPDGGTNADGSPRYQLYAVREDGLASVQLTAETEMRRVLYSAIRWGGADGFVIYRQPDAAGAGRLLYRVDIGWTAEHQPAPLTGAYEVFGAPTTSTIVYDVTRDGGKVVWHDLPLRSDSPLYTAPLPHGSSTAIGLTGFHPEWTGDALRLVFSTGGEIVTANADGSGRTVVARIARGSYDQLQIPHWSPGAGHLVYEYIYHPYESKGSDTYRVAADGSGKKNLTSDTGLYCSPVAWR